MTQSDSILDHLIRGGTLTPLDSWEMFGCSTLSQRFGEMRRDSGLTAHYDFHSAFVEVVARNGKIAHVKRYWITPKAGQLELM